MSITSAGNYFINEAIPNVPKHVTYYKDANIDGLLYWKNDTTMTLIYLNADNWSTTVTFPFDHTVEEKSIIGTPKNFSDQVSNAAKWVMWPHVFINSVTSNVNLGITAVSINGSLSASTFTTHIYDPAFTNNETVIKLCAMTDGIGALIQNTDSTYSVRMFTYPSSSFGSLTPDVSMTSTPVVANFSDQFPQQVMLKFGRDRVFSAYEETGNQVRIHYFDTIISGDDVSFSTVVNTTTNMPIANEVPWIGSIDGTYPLVAILLKDDSVLRLLTTAEDGTNPAVSTLSVTGSGGEGAIRRLMPYSDTHAFFYMALHQYLAKIDILTGEIVSETNFNTNDAIITQANGVPVIMGIHGGIIAYGTNAETTTVFGQTTDMGFFPTTVSYMGRVQNTPINSEIFLQDQGTSIVVLLKEIVESVPPVGTIYSQGYINFTTLDATQSSSLEIWPNGDVVGIREYYYGTYNTSNGTFNPIVNAVYGHFGNMGLAPNGRLYLNRGNGALSTWYPGEESFTTLSFKGGQAGGCDIFPNGLVIWGKTNVAGSDLYLYEPSTNTSTTLTGITTGFAYGIRVLSSGNVLVTDRSANMVREISIEGTGSIEYSFSLPFSPTNLYKYDTDKFLVMFYNGTTSIYNIDYSGGAGNEVLTEIPVTTHSAWNIGYGIIIGKDRNLYTSTYGGGFARAEPVD